MCTGDGADRKSLLIAGLIIRMIWMVTSPTIRVILITAQKDEDEIIRMI